MVEATNNDSFEKDTSEGLVFVDFWAAWCRPCKALAPRYEALSEEHTGAKFLKVDITTERDISKQNMIKSIPTVIAFKDGVEIARVNGGENVDKFVEGLVEGLAEEV